MMSKHDWRDDLTLALIVGVICYLLWLGITR